MENDKIENIIENMIDDYKENEQVIADNNYEYDKLDEDGYEDYLIEKGDWEYMTDEERQEAKEKYEAGNFDYYIRQDETKDKIESEILETKDIDKIIEIIENYIFFDDFDDYIKEGLLNLLKREHDYILNEWFYKKMIIVMQAGEYGIFTLKGIE